jgi:hypothetical protein
LICVWLGLTGIQGVPVVKPACALASHCIGVRALSRLIGCIPAITSPGSMPSTAVARA